MAYSHHTVALFDKKASQERLASRISALLDITLNDDNGLLNARYEGLLLTNLFENVCVSYCFILQETTVSGMTISPEK